MLCRLRCHRSVEGRSSDTESGAGQVSDVCAPSQLQQWFVWSSHCRYFQDATQSSSDHSGSEETVHLPVMLLHPNSHCRERVQHATS